MKTNTTNKNKKLDQGLMDYIQLLKEDPQEREKMNKFIQKETAKLKKNKETEYAAMFLSAIRF